VQAYGLLRSFGTYNMSHKFRYRSQNSKRPARVAGTHNIAVKVVDNDGLENIEVIKLKINGGVEQIE
jgi:hypothetical protein